MSERNAYITFLSNDRYLPGAMVLAHALKDGGFRDGKPTPGTSMKLAVLVGEGKLSQSSLDELRGLYDYVIPVPIIAGTAPDNLQLLGRLELNETFTKINLWKQTQFNKIVYLDADVLPITPPDELFQVPADFAACPDIGWPDCFNSGVMVLKPSNDTYDQLYNLVQSGESFDGADQGLLNTHFEGKWSRLPFTYNCTPSASYQYTPAYRHYGSKVSAVHFIGANKPWDHRADTYESLGPFGDHVQTWWNVWDKHYAPKGAEENQRWAHFRPPPFHYEQFEPGYNSHEPPAHWSPPPPVAHQEHQEHHDHHQPEHHWENHHHQPENHWEHHHHQPEHHHEHHHHQPEHHWEHHHHQPEHHHEHHHHQPEHHWEHHHHQPEHHHEHHHHQPEHHHEHHHHQPEHHHEHHHHQPEHHWEHHHHQPEHHHEHHHHQPEHHHGHHHHQPEHHHEHHHHHQPEHHHEHHHHHHHHHQPEHHHEHHDHHHHQPEHHWEHHHHQPEHHHEHHHHQPEHHHEHHHHHHHHENHHHHHENHHEHQEQHSAPAYDQYTGHQPSFNVGGTDYVHRSEEEDRKQEEQEPPSPPPECTYTPPFEAPLNEWDPARSPPPLNSSPEAYNIEFRTYRNEWDILLSPPEEKSSPISLSPPMETKTISEAKSTTSEAKSTSRKTRSKDRSSTKSAKEKSPPPPKPLYEILGLKPIFPWELRALPPTRVFADDPLPVETTEDLDSEVGSDDEDEDHYDDESVASLEEDIEEEETSDNDSGAESTASSWGGFIVNQWDTIPEISDYITTLQLSNPTFRLDYPGSSGSSEHYHLYDDDDRPSLPIKQSAFNRFNRPFPQKNFPYKGASGITSPDKWDPMAKLDDLRKLPVTFLERQTKKLADDDDDDDDEQEQQ